MFGASINFALIVEGLHHRNGHWITFLAGRFDFVENLYTLALTPQAVYVEIHQTARGLRKREEASQAIATLRVRRDLARVLIDK